MIYKHNFTVRVNDINIKQEMTNKAILECFENIASFQADEVGHGVKDIVKNKASWVILDWYMEVYKRPKYGDTIEVHTWAKPSNLKTSYRDFEVYVNGEKYVSATSKWALLSIIDKHVIEIDDDIQDLFGVEAAKSTFDTGNLPKLMEFDKYDEEQLVPIRKSDMDINGHMHNLNYLDLMNELVYKNEEINKIRIVYRKEIVVNDSIKVFRKRINDKIYFLIKNENGTVHCIIETN